MTPSGDLGWLCWREQRTGGEMSRDSADSLLMDVLSPTEALPPDSLVRRLLVHPSGPDSIAIRSGLVTMTYGDVLQALSRAIGAYREMGIAPGSRVAIVGPDSPVTAVAILAAIEA